MAASMQIRLYGLHTFLIRHQTYNMKNFYFCIDQLFIIINIFSKNIRKEIEWTDLTEVYKTKS